MSESTDITTTIRGEKLILSPEKALFWESRSMLILADLHLGKAGHFRKHGIAIPDSVNNENLDRLNSLITRYDPERILFLGDLFHSDKNEEWSAFEKWRTEHAHIEMHLAIGNHDFYPVDEYEQMGLQCSVVIEAGPFAFTHDAGEINSSSELYYISGHVHPSVRLTGKGRQSARLACFCFGEKEALLPAFGKFTGTHTIKPGVNDEVFVITGHQISKIS